MKKYNKYVNESPENETCVLCKKSGFRRCVGGDRYKKDFLQEFNIDFESIYTDHWKGYYFACDECLGKVKKRKIEHFLINLKKLKKPYLKNGSTTYWQEGIIDCISFLIKGTKEKLEEKGCFDGSYFAWLKGILEVFNDVKIEHERMKKK